VRRDAADELAFRRLARHDGEAALPETGKRAFLRVQAQLGLALSTIGAVAGKAVLREDGTHLAIELDDWLRGILCPGRLVCRDGAEHEHENKCARCRKEAKRSGQGRHHDGRILGRSGSGASHDWMIFVTACPYTSVRRKSRPARRYVSFSW